MNNMNNDIASKLRQIIQSKSNGRFFLRILRPPFIKGHFITDVFRFEDAKNEVLTEQLGAEGFICVIERGLGFIHVSDTALITKAWEIIGNNEARSFYNPDNNYEENELALSLQRFSLDPIETFTLMQAERELLFMLLCPGFFTRQEIIPRLRRLAAVCLRKHCGSIALSLGAVFLSSYYSFITSS